MHLPTKRLVSLVALASFFICETVLPTPAEAEPQEGAAVVVGIGAGVVLGTVALVELFHHKRTIRGCITEGPDGLQIEDESDHTVYLLRGKRAEQVRPGLAAAVRGRKKKKAHELQFVVKNVRAEYGPCGQPPAMVAVTAPAPAPQPQIQPKAGADLEASISATGTAALYGVVFDTNSSALRVDSETTLEKALAVIQKRPDSRWEIGGYTDDRGSSGLNQKLSDSRANAVRDWLVSHGISQDRLTAHGYGASHYVAANDTDEGRARNRRVELQLAR